MDKQRLAERIVQARKRTRLNQTEFGEKLSVTQAAVSLWEKGSSEPSILTLIEIARLAGWTVDQLLGIEGGITMSDENLPPEFAAIKKAIDATAQAIEYQRLTFIEAVEQQRADYNEGMRNIAAILERLEHMVGPEMDRVRAELALLSERLYALESAQRGTSGTATASDVSVEHGMSIAPPAGLESAEERARVGHEMLGDAFEPGAEDLPQSPLQDEKTQTSG